MEFTKPYYADIEKRLVVGKGGKGGIGRRGGGEGEQVGRRGKGGGGGSVVNYCLVGQVMNWASCNLNTRIV